jgi:hypothetical protein
MPREATARQPLCVDIAGFACTPQGGSSPYAPAVFERL